MSRDVQPIHVWWGHDESSRFQSTPQLHLLCVLILHRQRYARNAIVSVRFHLSVDLFCNGCGDSRRSIQNA